ncbi:hypothetical protein COCVIDRAFT_95658, partial [Bipolaris victoriae FI3]
GGLATPAVETSRSRSSASYSYCVAYDAAPPPLVEFWDGEGDKKEERQQTRTTLRLVALVSRMSLRLFPDCGPNRIF